MENLFRKLREILAILPPGFWVITFTYILVILLMLPFRQVGFQDDFAYYLTVKNFLATGQLKINEWAAVSLISQVYWGSLFGTIFGFSYKTLHFSMVILFYFGLIFFYKILNLLNFSDKKAMFASLLLLSVPSILRLTFTFMSDISYLSLMIIAVYFSLKALKTDSVYISVVASALSMIAYLDRQLGLGIVISLFLVFLYKSFMKRKLYIHQLVGILVPALIIFVTYNHWLNIGDNKTLGQYLYMDRAAQYLRMYIVPQGLGRMRPTSEIYEDIVYRLARYLQYLLVYITPLILVFNYKKIDIFSYIKSKKYYLLASFVFLIFIYWTLLTREKNLDIFNLKVFTPLEILGLNDQGVILFWNKLWNIVSALFFPVWVYFLAKFFEKVFTTIFRPSGLSLAKRWLMCSTI